MDDFIEAITQLRLEALSKNETLLGYALRGWQSMQHPSTTEAMEDLDRILMQYKNMNSNDSKISIEVYQHYINEWFRKWNNK